MSATIRIRGALSVAIALAALVSLARPVAAEEAGDTFEINPRVLQLSGRPGERLSFEVTVSARTTAQTVEVSAADFTQDEEGRLIPVATSATATADLWIDGPRRLVLPPGASAVVHGTVAIAQNGPVLRLLGMRFLGDPADAASIGRTGDAEAGVHVRIAYVARIEVRVDGAYEARASELRLTSGGLVADDGRPMARAYLENPTDRAIELEAECQLFQASPRRRVGPTFAMILPTNATRSGATRIVSNVLPGARVRLEELLPYSVSPGGYVLSVKLVAGRERIQREFPLDVTADDSPAQAFLFGRSVGAVFVSPSQIELSESSGHSRLVPLLLENTGNSAVDIDLSPEKGSEDWLVVRPSSVTLAPGTRRRVAVTLANAKDARDRHYGAVLATVKTAGATPAESRFPVAVVPRDAGEPLIESGALERVAGEDSLAFTLMTRNSGARHAPLDATLAVTDAHGMRVARTSAGFGEWLLPGVARQLSFRVEKPLPAGKYTISATVGGAILRDSDGRPAEIALDWAGPRAPSATPSTTPSGPDARAK